MQVVWNYYQTLNLFTPSNCHLWELRFEELAYHAEAAAVLCFLLIFGLISRSFVETLSQTAQRKWPTSSYWSGRGAKMAVLPLDFLSEPFSILIYITEQPLAQLSANVTIWHCHNFKVSQWHTHHISLAWYLVGKRDHPLLRQVVPIYDHRASGRQQK